MAQQDVTGDIVRAALDRTSAGQHGGSISLVLAILVWLAGLGAIYFLWQRDSSAFFQARSQRVR